MVDDGGPRGLPRRGVLAGAACAVLLGTGRGAAAPGKAAPVASPRLREFRLTPREASVPIVGGGYPDTGVWAYDGAVPGPEIRVRQGDRVRVVVENRLGEETTVHWHGLRVPNAMDGVPGLTQPPIAPGGSFVYEFDALDAGTFWYHPHARSFEQVERGLAGALVVEEADPVLAVDRDVTWVLDDWRLTRDAAVAGGFGGMMDASHAGRLGNTATINGRVPDAFPLRAGERLRLRLVNVANARVFGLEFEGHRPLVVALDGQPVEPHEPADGRVVLGPAQRADLVLDATGEAGERFEVVDGFYARRRYRLVDLAYGGATPLRGAPPGPPARLPPNPLPEPDLAGAVRHAVEFGGGMMDPKMMRGGGRDGGGMRGRMDGGDMGQMGDHGRMGRRGGGGMDGSARHRGVWTINGVSAVGEHHLHEPVLTLERGRSYVLDMLNDTSWWHPMHLHGHVFRVLSRDGRPAPRREWLDTVLMAPGERVEIAFVADNPGDWMFHCHVLEHQAAGMMAVVRVA